MNSDRSKYKNERGRHKIAHWAGQDRDFYNLAGKDNIIPQSMPRTLEEVDMKYDLQTNQNNSS